MTDIRKVSSHLTELFASSVVGDKEVVLAVWKSQLFVAVVIGEGRKGNECEVLWYAPANSRKGYMREVSFVPAMNKQGMTQADYVPLDSLYPVTRFLCKRHEPLEGDEELKFSLTFPQMMDVINGGGESQDSSSELDWNESDSDQEKNQFDGDSDGDSVWDASEKVGDSDGVHSQEESEWVEPCEEMSPLQTLSERASVKRKQVDAPEVSPPPAKPKKMDGYNDKAKQ